MTECSLNQLISPASTNRAPIHHESAKSLRPGQFLISSPLIPSSYLFPFCGNFFSKFLVLGNLTCTKEPRCIDDYSYFQKGCRKKCTHNPERYCGWLSRAHLLIFNPLLLAFRILQFSEILSVDKDTTNVLHHLKSILCRDVCYLTNTV